MYICLECGYRFEYPLQLKEKHDFSNPPYEKIWVCPRCQSGNFEKREIKYCRACGARLSGDKTDYCTEACKNNAKKLWRKEIARKKRLSDSDIFRIVREIDSYNHNNKRKLSYGQYVALKSAKKRKGGKKNES